MCPHPLPSQTPVQATTKKAAVASVAEGVLPPSLQPVHRAARGLGELLLTPIYLFQSFGVCVCVCVCVCMYVCVCARTRSLPPSLPSLHHVRRAARWPSKIV